MPEPDRSSQRERWEMGAGLAWMMAVAIGAIVGGSLVHAHFAPKEALCNAVAGAIAQQQSGGASAHCGLDSFLSQTAIVVRWAGIVGLVGMAGLALWAGYAATQKGHADGS